MGEQPVDADHRVTTGVPGFDRVLHGGYLKGSTTLIEGAPGTGKTTLALQFLLAGAQRGEKGLFLSVAQSALELETIASSHGMDLSAITVHSPELGEADGERSFSVESDEADLIGLLREIDRRIEEVDPDLFVFDSLLELRLLASPASFYRRELLTLRRHLRQSSVTSLLLDHLDVPNERHAEGIMHCAIRLEADSPPIGIYDRRLSVVKMRGSSFEEGFHDFRIRKGGVAVFPRVVPSESREGVVTRQLAPPLPAMAGMLGGGLEYGTTTLISGQSGTGKSTMSTVFAVAAANQGVRSALFLFEERPEVFRERSRGVGLDLDPRIADGTLTMEHFDPAEISPGEFSRGVIDVVERDGVRLVVLDSLSGYLAALPDRRNVNTHLHSLLQYLSRRGVLVIVTLAQHGLLGEEPRTDIDTSYLADSIIMLRQYAAGSEIRRSIAVLKKRHSEHERSIQELVIRPGAVEVRPLEDGQFRRAHDAAELKGP